MTEVESDAYAEMLTELAGTVGLERLETGVRKAIAECEYMPTRAELEQRIPAAESTARTRCGLCAESEGWRRVKIQKWVWGELKEIEALKKCDHAGQRTFTEDQIERGHRITPREAMEALAELPEETQKKLADIFGDKKITPKSVVEAVEKMASAKKL